MQHADDEITPLASVPNGRASVGGLSRTGDSSNVMRTVRKPMAAIVVT